MVPPRNFVACSPSRYGLFSVGSGSVALSFTLGVLTMLPRMSSRSTSNCGTCFWFRVDFHQFTVDHSEQTCVALPVTCPSVLLHLPCKGVWEVFTRKMEEGFRDKKGFGKGEFRDKEGGKSNSPENYKQVRLKLQGDRLNRGWRDQSTRATY